MPFMLSSLVGRSVGITLPAGPLLKALVETLLVPLLIGKVSETRDSVSPYLLNCTCTSSSFKEDDESVTSLE